MNHPRQCPNCGGPVSVEAVQVQSDAPTPFAEYHPGMWDCDNHCYEVDRDAFKAAVRKWETS